MAISVNKVYRTVLSIMNKEGRGFLTPDQFNRIGREVQLDLLERAFFDYNKALNRKKGSATNDEYGNIPKNIKEKIDIFSKEAELTISGAGLVSLPADLYRVILLSRLSRSINLEELNKSEYTYINSSKLTAPSGAYPVYYRDSTGIKVSPISLANSDITLDYIKVPADPFWAYNVSAGNGSYAYNSGASIDFDLHIADEVDLTIKILGYVGVIIKDPTIIQVANSEETKIIQLEN
jgi:hypothetical protein